MGWCCLLTNAYVVGAAAAVLAIIAYFTKSKKADLNGKHVLITGGSSGIGLAVGHEVAKHGASITLVARSMGLLRTAQEAVEKTAAAAGKGGKVQVFSVDVCSDAVANMVCEAEATLGPIYMLVNCAGIAIPARFEDLSLEQVKSMMDVNFYGTFSVTQAVLRSMKQREQMPAEPRHGILVMTSSLAGMLGLYGFTGYAAAKAALIKFAEALHMEVAPHNVSVTVCLPPDTDTPGLAKENLIKPVETKLISESAGLVKPEEVAAKLVDDAVKGQFYSTVGLDGFMLATLCAGMAPITDICTFITQVCLSGLFRVVSGFYLWSFGRIIRQEFAKRMHSKKAE